MLSRRHKRTAVFLLALFGAVFALETQAEARRYYRRGLYRRPAPAVYVGRGVAVRAPFVGVRVGPLGGVRVAAPGVRVGVGF